MRVKIDELDADACPSRLTLEMNRTAKPEVTVSQVAQKKNTVTAQPEIIICHMHGTRGGCQYLVLCGR